MFLIITLGRKKTLFFLNNVYILFLKSNTGVYIFRGQEKLDIIKSQIHPYRISILFTKNFISFPSFAKNYLTFGENNDFQKRGPGEIIFQENIHLCSVSNSPEILTCSASSFICGIL